MKKIRKKIGSKVGSLRKLEPQPKQRVLIKELSVRHPMVGHNVSFSRSGEGNLEERLDGLVSVPQEWHKKKVSRNLQK